MKLWRTNSNPAQTGIGHSKLRGKTISNPIPIPSMRDEEFPIRSPDTEAAAAVDVSDSNRQLEPPPSGASNFPDAQGQVEKTESTPPMPLLQPEREAPAVPEPPSIPPEPAPSEYHSQGHSFSRPNTSPQQNTSLQQTGSDSPPKQQHSPPRPQESPRRQNSGNNAARASIVSVASTGPSQQGRNTPQRKKSTLRTALGRLFGRKKKVSSTGGSGLVGDNLTPVRSSSQNQIDPTTLGHQMDRELEPKRSASLPITEFDRALRSHSVGPEDMTAIESARNSLQTEPAGRRRAATTTSGLLHSQPVGEWGGLSPRPASTYGRESRLLSATDLDGGADHDPNEIGRAITLDHGSRRRSRSLSGLEDLENQHGDGRRRSDEIRYWRESYDPGFRSPTSSNGPEGDNVGGGGREGDENANRVNPDVDASTTMPATPATFQLPSPTAGQVQVSRTPPQPFTFQMDDVVGMKITRAANMETRINNLESSVKVLKHVVQKLCHQTPGFDAMLSPDAEPPTACGLGVQGIKVSGSEQRQQSSSSMTNATTTVPPAPMTYPNAENASHASFDDAHTVTGSTHPQIDTIPVSTIPGPFVLPDSPPTSNSTVRGAISLDRLHAAEPCPVATGVVAGADAEDYQNLMALISAERSARLALEEEVRSLARRVDLLSSSNAAPISQRVLNIPVSQQDLELPGTAKSLGVFSAFDDDDDDDYTSDGQGNDSGCGGLDRETAAFEIITPPEDTRSTALYGSAFETPPEEEEEDVTPSIIPHGAAAAPMTGTSTGEEAAAGEGGEEEAYGYGAFGEELRPDDGLDGRKAARTLSLSQLSMPKKEQQQQQQQQQQRMDIAGVPDVPPTPTGPGVAMTGLTNHGGVF